MKSRTSFFSATVLKKNILRFAPVWGLYTLIMLLYLFISVGNSTPAMLAKDVKYLLGPMASVNFAYAGICAILLFGDLYNSRMCNALHAFPLRRDGWLLTNVVSGILFSVVPNILMTVLGGILLQEYAYMAAIWLAVMVLMFLFFFGTAVLSAVCAGNRLAMAAIYAIIHFIALLVFAVFELIYQPILYGVIVDSDAFIRFCPLPQLSSFDFVEFQYSYGDLKGQFMGFEPEAWPYLGLCTVAGLVGFVLAWRVYLGRKMETAGDFISLRPLAPVFLVIFTVGVGTVFYLMSALFGDETLILFLIGLPVGFFVGQMLLNRKVNVFGKKSLTGFGILLLALVGSILLTWLDPIGITRRVPKLENIAWGSVYSERDDYLYSRPEDASLKISDPAELESMRKFHSSLIKNPGWEDTCEVRILYALKDGSHMYRSYEVAVDSELGEEAKQWFSDPRYVFQTNDATRFYQNVESVVVAGMGGKFKDSEWTEELDEIKLVGDDVADFLNAVMADCEAGLMAQSYEFHPDEEELFDVHFDCNDAFGSGRRRYYINIYNGATNTVQYIKNAVSQQEGENK